MATRNETRVMIFDHRPLAPAFPYSDTRCREASRTARDKKRI